MVIETRIAGKKGRALDRWSIPTPPGADAGDGGSGITLRDLITRVVRAEVAAFDQREQARRLMRVLSSAEIAQGAARGKIDSGGRAPAGPVNANAAVGAALQGFEDGLFLVILDGIEQRSLDAQVFPRPDSQLVFLRLTFLAGA